MSIRRLDPGARMSEAVLCGDRVVLSGMVADTTVGASVTEQTRDILAQIDALLARAGTDKTQAIRALIWLTDITTIDEMNAVWDAWVMPGHTPARATVEAKLAHPGWSVEIMVEAFIPSR